MPLVVRNGPQKAAGRLRRDEGFLLPDHPPLKEMPKINSTLGTDAQRKRLHPKKVKPPNLFQPTVRAVKEIVPNKSIPKLKPLQLTWWQHA